MRQSLIVSLAFCWLSAWAQFNNQQLTNNGYYNGEPGIAVNGDNLAVAYESYEFGNDEIMLLTSPDKGATFSAPVRVTSNDSASWRPKVVVNDGIDIVWEDRRTGKREIFYARYQGGALGPALKVSGGNIYSAFPSLANDGNDLFITWEDFRDGNDEIYFRKKVSGVWSPEKRLTSNDSTSWGSDIVCDPIAGKLHVVFFDYRTGNDEVYYIASSDKGETWSAPVNISNDLANSWEPRVAAYGDRVAVSWYSWDSATASYEIYFAESVSGSDFSVPQRVSEPGADSKCPAIAMDNTVTIITWEDYKDGNDEIYAFRKPHTEISWHSRRITADTSDSFGADVVLAGTDLLISWFDYRTGVDQIWFAKGAPADVSRIETTDRAILARPCVSASPNPFNGTAKIALSIPEGFHGKSITIRIHDMLGREVKRCKLDMSVFAQGLRWNAAGLPSGVYCIEAQAGQWHAVTRAVMMK